MLYRVHLAMKRVRTAGELLVPEGTICPGIVMVIRYIYYLQLLNKVTVIKTKVLFPQGLVTLAGFGYLFYVFWFACSPNTFNLFGIAIF